MDCGRQETDCDLILIYLSKAYPIRVAFCKILQDLDPDPMSSVQNLSTEN